MKTVWFWLRVCFKGFILLCCVERSRSQNSKLLKRINDCMIFPGCIRAKVLFLWFCLTDAVLNALPHRNFTNWLICLWDQPTESVSQPTQTYHCSTWRPVSWLSQHFVHLAEVFGDVILYGWLMNRKADHSITSPRETRVYRTPIRNEVMAVRNAEIELQRSMWVWCQDLLAVMNDCN